MLPSKRCIVEASSGICSFIFSGQSSSSLPRLIASCNLAAAFPVGAARAIRRLLELDCSRHSARIFATVVVLPVPGPPEITQNLSINEVKAATFCQSMSSAWPGEH